MNSTSHTPGSFEFIDDLIRSQDSKKAQGNAFERLCRVYLQKAPKYRGQFKRVWLWADWPGRSGVDKGIDLVAETTDGSLWAIQAKAYDPARSISKRDIDSFLSESNRPEFSYRLLIAST